MNEPTQNRGRLRVLVLSRNYPNNVTSLLGLWVQELVRESARYCELTVVSPVPYCPPIPGLPESYARFRRADRRSMRDGVEVLHPRFPAGPGYSTHRIESMLYYAAVRRPIGDLQRRGRFDLIHAHFTYPDGVVATYLGRRYGVPVIVTEQNPWGPWMNRYHGVRRRAIQAARQSACFIAISEYVRETVEQFAGKLDNVAVIPDGVRGSVFQFRAAGRKIPNQILFVGAIRPVKGVDVLLKSMRLLVDRGRDVQLILIGETYYGPYRREEQRLERLSVELDLAGRVRFAGKKSLDELVRHMQESAVLVLPSRAESLGMVLVEALACGTPVVATRCGGPEEIVNEKVGVLVPAEDPGALALGIERVLDRPQNYDPATLRAYALEKFGIENVGTRVLQVYRKAVADFHAPIIPGDPNRKAART